MTATFSRQVMHCNRGNHGKEVPKGGDAVEDMDRVESDLVAKGEQNCPVHNAIRPVKSSASRKQRVLRLLRRRGRITQENHGGFEEIGRIDCLLRPLVEVEGKQVGRYRLIERLGSGGYGQVFLGRKNLTLRTFAVKVQRKSDLQPMHKLERANQEIGLMRAHSHHPNIIGFHQKINTPEKLYIVMEKATMDLTSLLFKTNVFQGRQTDVKQQVMLGILRATTYLHERGIAHLDLKPCNVLVQTSALSDDGTLIPGRRIEANSIRLCDFGMACVSANYDPKDTKIDFDYDCYIESSYGLPKKHFVALKGAFGTTGYMAPEMFSGQWYDGRRADDFSVGCILSVLTFQKIVTEECLVGFKTKNHEEKGQLKDLLEDLLSGPLLYRTTSKRAMKHQWFRCLQEKAATYSSTIN
ncbi:MAP/microtubule affinity-regulating kinase 3 [Seminavis robusta]|uniref:MAP/microtubule affinity-regulating kinase 3 n=1 Tax=Seminavis robusta TaxID=568900 RepID=A0A9N8DDD3_9STRA|nr:MAP/microtubule affinity-regulating kinase 3 [Seminavis robusta]|eukprot:Sro43_g026160.1 MAP/microtubule affinity-regulating kinase 3 (411) ;mRNA; r:70189-71421